MGIKIGTYTHPVIPRLMNLFAASSFTRFRSAIAVFTTLLMCGSSTAQQVTHEAVSRCFFIYAASHEAARELGHRRLFQYIHPRIGWMTGYMHANQSDPTLARIFEKNLNSNKQRAIGLDKKIRRAVRTRDPASFDTAVDHLLNCDRELGIDSKWRPKL